MANKFVSTEQRNLLIRSKVPIRRRQHFQRKILQDRFCQELKEFLNDPDGRWFLVCGMVGSGKSKLVSDVLYDRPEFCFALISRLIWLKECSPNRWSMSGEKEEEWATFAKESTLIGSFGLNDGQQVEEFVDESELDEMDNWQMLGQIMARELANGMVDTLLLLDGVTSGDTVRFFDEFKPENCKLLATSTNCEIFRMVDGLRIFRMDECNELSQEELAQMAKCFGIKEEFTEQNLEWILQETGGNLALLDKIFTLARGDQKIFNSLLANFSNTNHSLSEFNCHSTYSYTSLERPIQKCMEMIGNRIAQNFLHCSVLERSIWTPFEIISMIWPLDICGMNDDAQNDGLKLQQIQTVTHHSLLDFCQPNKFRLQPLIQNFLLHSLPNSHQIFMRSCQCLLAKLRQSDLNGPERKYLAQNEKRLSDLMKIIQKMPPKGNGRQINGANGQSSSFFGDYLNPTGLANMFYRSMSWPEK